MTPAGTKRQECLLRVDLSAHGGDGIKREISATRACRQGLAGGAGSGPDRNPTNRNVGLNETDF
jgi:hypothetical protein